MSLDKIKLGVCPISGEIFLVDTSTPTPTEHPFTGSARAAVVQHLMHDAPKGAHMDVQVGDQWYRISVKPLKASAVSPN